jgi:hypothetical protein
MKFVPMFGSAMYSFVFCLVAQALLAFGVTGVVWPDKLMPLFGVLMFPWSANHRVIRANGIAAIGIYFLLVGRLFVVGV